MQQYLHIIKQSFKHCSGWVPNDFEGVPHRNYIDSGQSLSCESQQRRKWIQTWSAFSTVILNVSSYLINLPRATYRKKRNTKNVLPWMIPITCSLGDWVDVSLLEFASCWQLRAPFPLWSRAESGTWVIRTPGGVANAWLPSLFPHDMQIASHSYSPSDIESVCGDKRSFLSISSSDWSWALCY